MPGSPFSLLAAGTLEQLEANIAGSSEYFQLHGGGNDSFLTALYGNVLNRAVDASGRAAWDAALAQGLSRAQVAADIFASDEYRGDLVEGYYERFLHRAVDAGGLNASVAALGNGMTDLQVIALLLGSQEYYADLA